MTQNPSDNQPEIIFKVGVEGGGITFYRRLVETDRWEFWLESVSMDFDENDDEVWRTSQSEPVQSWDALEQQLGIEWIVYPPHNIHSEYRDLIRMAVR